MTAPRSAVAPLGDIKKLSEGDGAEAAVQVMTWGKPRVKAVWSLLASIDVLPCSMPASDPKVALALVKADIGEDALNTLNAVAQLARRGW